MQLHPPELGVELQGRLLRGEHLTLLGPRGSGKSALLARLHSQFVVAGIPCAYSSITTSLDDITRALERAYPDVDAAEVTRRSARARLWAAADLRRGILLLDHFSAVSNAMVFLLKRLHGGVAGVLTAIDIEGQRDRSRIRRPSRYGAMTVRMPSTPIRQLRRLFYALTGGLGLPPLAASVEQRLLEAARGRPGWIVKCAELACDSRYWSEHGLLVSALHVDTEAAVRCGALNLLRAPRAEPVYPMDSGQSLTEGGSEASGLMTPKQAGV
jgi:hypothetical protein